MPKLSTVLKGGREDSLVKIEYEGQQFSVWYSIKRYTPAFEAEIAESSGGKWQSAFLVKFIEGLVTNWDVEDDEGIALPIVEQVLNTLPVDFLDRIVATISEDAQPSPEVSGPSAAG